MKVNNLRIKSGILAIIVAGGITLGTTTDCLASTKYKEGTFIEETVELNDKVYNQYVVKVGDNLSRISRKICRYFNETVSTEYWPAIAFLNNYPRIIRPGDIIVFPESFETLVSMNNSLKENGWTGRYIRKNDVYNKNSLHGKDIVSLLEDIYGEYIFVNEDFIKTYLEMQGLDDKYEIKDLQSMDYNTIFELTEWIPTIKEITDYEIERNSKEYSK